MELDTRRTVRDRENALVELQRAKEMYGPSYDTCMAQAEYRSAAWRVVELNISLLHWVLRPVALKDIYDDLVSELTFTLFKACYNWDSSLGTFSTYVVACIRTSYRTVASELRQLDRPVRMPNGLRTDNELQKLKTQIDERVAPLRESYEIAEAHERTEAWWAIHGKESAQIGRQIKKYLAAETMNKSTVRHTQLLRDVEQFIYGETSTISQVIDEDIPSLEDGAESLRLREVIDYILAQFSEREIGIIRLRFGLGNSKNEGMTLDEVGRKFGVTRERIRSIEAKTLKKIRQSGRSRRILGAFILPPSIDIQRPEIVETLKVRMTPKPLPTRGQQSSVFERVCALIASICSRSVRISDSSQYDLVKLNQTLDQVLSTILPREAYVVQLRFGTLHSFQKGITQTAIADILGVSPGRVSRIEANAMAKLRIPFRSNLLKRLLL